MSSPLFCWHSWAKWSEPHIVTIVKWIRDQSWESQAKIQDRTCGKCGKYQERKVRIAE